MRNMTTALAAVLTMLALGACAKKEEAPAAPAADAPPAAAAPATDAAPAADAAPTETAPADANPDAPATGGDKVKP
jgi:hypothetical protein